MGLIYTPPTVRLLKVSLAVRSLMVRAVSWTGMALMRTAKVAARKLDETRILIWERCGLDEIE